MHCVNIKNAGFLASSPSLSLWERVASAASRVRDTFAANPDSLTQPSPRGREVFGLRQILLPSPSPLPEGEGSLELRQILLPSPNPLPEGEGSLELRQILLPSPNPLPEGEGSLELRQ